MVALQKQQEQQRELAELIRQRMVAIQKQQEQGELTEPVRQTPQATKPGEVAESIPTPITDLLHTLHIEPSCFATPEEEENIVSTPPTSPKMQINHMTLRTVPSPIPQVKQICTSDNTTRVQAPTQTTNNNVYIPKYKSMHVRIYLHTCKKRDEEHALLDSRATENFMNLTYA